MNGTTLLALALTGLSAVAWAQCPTAVAVTAAQVPVQNESSVYLCRNIDGPFGTRLCATVDGVRPEGSTLVWEVATGYTASGYVYQPVVPGNNTVLFNSGGSTWFIVSFWPGDCLVVHDWSQNGQFFGHLRARFVAQGCPDVELHFGMQSAALWCPYPEVHCPDIGTCGGIRGSDGQLDNNDFVAFINGFFNAHEYADFGGQGGIPVPDGRFDNNDFILFIDAFFRWICY